MRTVRIAALLAAVPATLAAGLSGIASGAPESTAAFSCPARTGKSPTVGTITNVLHSKVYVGDKYVGTTPFPLASGNSICTDNTGEAVFNLARSNKSLVCIALRSTRVELTPENSLTTNLQRGTTWCSIRPSDGNFAAPIAGLRLNAPNTQGLVGMTVDPKSRTARIRVYQGKVTLRRNSARGNLLRPATVSSSKQALVRANGQLAVEPFRPGADELVVIAQLRLARPTPR